MIARVTLGSGFAELMRYLMRGKGGDSPERVEWTASRSLPFKDPALVPVVMQAVADQAPRVEKPVYHLMISLDQGERLDQLTFEGVVDRTLADLGLEDHQALVVAHRDREHAHVHVMVNRVHPETLKAWSNRFDYARIEKSLRQQERELGLREVPGRHFALPGQDRFQGASRTLPTGARRAAERTGRPSFVELARDLARPELRRAQSWSELHKQLDDLGLGLAKRGRGLVLFDGERAVKISLVDRQASLAKLETRFGIWQPPSKEQKPSAERWRDVVLLRRLGERLSRDRATEDSREQDARAERFEYHRAKEERLREKRQLSDRLDRQLARIYRDPARARRLLMDRAKDDVALPASLVQRPEAFGQLRGRGGMFTSAERWEALDVVPEAAATLRQVVALGQAPTQTPRVTQPAIQERRTRRLDRLAGRLIRKLGWKLAARVLPLPHLHALRLTLKVGRAVLAPVRDLGRER